MIWYDFPMPNEPRIISKRFILLFSTFALVLKINFSNFLVRKKSRVFPANISLFKVNKKKVWNMIKVNNRGTRRCSGVYIVKFEHIPHLFLVLLLDDL